MRPALQVILRLYNIGEYYINKNFVHAKDESLYITTKKDIILKQVYHATIGERKKKLVQFFCLFPHVS